MFIGLERIPGVSYEREEARQKQLLRGEVQPPLPPPVHVQAAAAPPPPPGAGTDTRFLAHAPQAPFALPEAAAFPAHPFGLGMAPVFGFPAAGAGGAHFFSQGVPVTRSEAGPVALDSDPGESGPSAPPPPPPPPPTAPAPGPPALPPGTRVLVVRAEDAANAAVDIVAAQVAAEGVAIDQRVCPMCTFANSHFMLECEMCLYNFGSAAGQ